MPAYLTYCTPTGTFTIANIKAAQFGKLTVVEFPLPSRTYIKYNFEVVASKRFSPIRRFALSQCDVGLNWY